MAGIAISVYIILSWMKVAAKQIDKIVGVSAPEDFIQCIKEMSASHDESMEVDVVRAYHFGHRYCVEIEVVFPANRTVEVSHDVAMDLQQKVEALKRAERAFVHMDYQKRDVAKHKIDWIRESCSMPRRRSLNQLVFWRQQRQGRVRD